MLSVAMRDVPERGEAPCDACSPRRPHVDPDTTEFFDEAIEVCDATVPYVDDNVDEAGGPFLPGLVRCDWTSRLVREVAAS